MSNIRIKICGITNLADALAAVEAGADALGFMFYEPSPRYVRPEAAAAIIQALPPFIATVGVFVDSPEAVVREMIATTRLDTLQFHGVETPEYCGRFSSRVIKAFRVRDAASIEELDSYRSASWLLDAYVPGQLGGTGALFNWDLAVKAVQKGGRVILAGGLTAQNVAEAVRRVRPFAVDVSSGVESAPGRKDPVKLRHFIQAARQA